MKKSEKPWPSPRRQLSKMIMMIKLTAVFICLMSLQISAKVHAQNVSLRMEDATFKEIAKAIEQQSGFTFLYGEAEVSQLRYRDVRFENSKIEDVLNKCLEGSKLSFRIVENTIVLIPAPPASQSKQVIQGRVTDKSGAGLPGVTVLIKGTRIGTATDTKGDFRLELGEIKNITLIFSFVGMQTKEVDITGTQPLTVVLEETPEAIQEVVVTGIYQRKKESFTGSATTYSGSDLQTVGSRNIIQSLKSLDPAFAMLENNDFGSDPNRLPDLEIRGKSSIVGLKEQYSVDPNQPLFILDGFETSLRTIMDMDMERVASVTILKDAASTAIYGAKAANGVVVVETKSPEKGKMRVTYNGNFNISMPDLTSYNLMNSEEKILFEQKAGLYTLGRDQYTPEKQTELEELYYERLTNVRRGVNTYWLSEPLRVGLDHRHSLYVEGGDEYMRYGLGANYNGIQGVMKDSERKIFSGNLDFIYRKDRFLFSNKLTINYNNTKDPVVPFSDYARANPYYEKYNASGEPERLLDNSMLGKPGNPLWNSAQNSRGLGRSWGITENFSAEYNPVDILRLRARFGVTKSVSETDRFISPQDSRFENITALKKGTLEYGNSKSLQYEGDFTATLGHVIGEKHRINMVAGANFSSAENVSNGYRAEGFPKGNYTTPAFSKGFPENAKPDYSESLARSVDFYGNGSYSFDDRYLLDLTCRLSGSSVFGSNRKYTNTWAVGVAWNLHNESFIRDNAGWINLLKIRGSVGNPGNQNFSAFQTFTVYAFQTAHVSFYDQGVILNSLGNPDLEWQTTLDRNVGLDLTFFGQKLSVNLDYYNKLTDPLLVQIGVPSSLGTSTLLTNMGQQIASGFNGTVTYSPVYRPADRIVWSFRYNFRAEKARYDKIGNKLDKFNETSSNTSLTRHFDGSDPDGLYAVRSAGIDPSSGQEIFIRKDGTYTLDFNYNDEVKVGVSRPKIEGIFGTSFTYKGFSCNIDFRYRLGGQRFNTALFNKVENISRGGLTQNQDKRALYDRWQNTGDIARYKKISLTETTPMSSRFVEDDNSLSLESFRVGYEFESDAIRRIGLRTLRLNAYMNDIFRISSIKTERGLEYPFARSVSFSLSASF